MITSEEGGIARTNYTSDVSRKIQNSSKGRGSYIFTLRFIHRYLKIVNVVALKSVDYTCLTLSLQCSLTGFWKTHIWRCRTNTRTRGEGFVIFAWRRRKSTQCIYLYSTITMILKLVMHVLSKHSFAMSNRILHNQIFLITHINSIYKSIHRFRDVF